MTHSCGRSRALAVAALLLAPAAAGAQAVADRPAEPEHWRPARGQYSVSFSLPDGGGAGFGIWRQARAIALGLQLNGSFGATTVTTPAGEEELTTFAIGGGPALKWYGWTASPVSPYLRLGTAVGYTAQSDGDVGRWGLDLSGTGGLGVDWFPTEGISIGGFAGVRVLYQTSQFDDDSQEQNRFAVDLLTSELTLHIYY